MPSELMRWRVDPATTTIIVLTCVALVWANRGGIWPPPPPGRAVPEASIPLDGAALEGSLTALLAIVVFTDYQCPYCARFERTTLEQLRRQYAEAGHVRIAVRQHPLEAIHPQAFGAAVAAICAGRQEKFRAMHDRLFDRQKGLDPTVIETLGQDIGLNAAAFARCRASDEVAAQVRSDIASAEALGLTGTPAFLIGRVQPDGKVKVNAVVSGARPLTEFTRILDNLLRERTSRLWWRSASVTAVVLVAGVGLVGWRARWARRRGFSPTID